MSEFQVGQSKQTCDTCDYYRKQYEKLQTLCREMERELEQYDVVKQGAGKVVKLLKPTDE